MRLVVGIVLLGIFLPVNSAAKNVWTWKCKEKGCIKEEAAEEKDEMSENVCKLICHPGILWPKPHHVSMSSEVVPINANSITFESATEKLPPETNELLRKAYQAWRIGIERLLEGSSSTPSNSLVIEVEIAHPDFTGFSLKANESYTLNVAQGSDSRVKAKIKGETYLGALHGLETLRQLIVYDPNREHIVIPSNVNITDAPLYPYRGVLLDTARSFISVASIKRTLDAMSASKLNTFHWHITDSQSFPLQSETYPKLTEYGAYAPNKVYSKEDIREIVEYGRVRGIRVLPELDAPAHVGEGWQWAGDATVCFKAEPWKSYCVEPPCGQLNPTSDNMYTILEGIYKDMSSLFDSDLFHMGGDEVNINCWNTSDIIVENMAKMGLGRSHEDFHELWSRFQKRALAGLEKASGKQRPVILWTSSLTEKGHVDKYLNNSQYIIQIWTTGHDPVIGQLIEKGFPVIFSNYDALYLDCGFGAWVGEGNNWCSPYIPWQKIYSNDPLKMVKGQGISEETARKMVLGAEATLWTEQADDSSIDNRLWPRAAAMAERLWGTKEDWKAAEQRFLAHRQRLVTRGVHADTIQPQWCLQNPNYCYA